MWCPADAGAAPAGPSIGELCPRSCGWCSSPIDFVRIANIAKPFCAEHRAAQCLPADGSCDGNGECQSACALVDITSQPHPTSAAATCEAVPGCEYHRGANAPAGCVVHPFTMSVQEMAWLSAAMSGNSGLVGINAKVCQEQGLDGPRVIDITRDDFIAFGMTYAQASGKPRRD